MPSLVETRASRSKLSLQLAGCFTWPAMTRPAVSPPMYWTYTPGRDDQGLNCTAFGGFNKWPAHGGRVTVPPSPFHPFSKKMRSAIMSDLARLQTMGDQLRPPRNPSCSHAMAASWTSGIGHKFIHINCQLITWKTESNSANKGQ